MLKPESSEAQYHHYQSLAWLQFFDKWILSQAQCHKTNETYSGSRKAVPQLVKIKDHMVEMVPNFKYLGIALDPNLTFNGAYKKALQRMFLLRKLRGFGVSSNVLETIYNSVVENEMTFNIMSWYGHLTVKNKAKLTKVVNRASKKIGKTWQQLTDLYIKTVERKATQILIAQITHLDHRLHSPFSFSHLVGN